MSRLTPSEIHVIQLHRVARAAVLGATDGIVSTSSLVVGVAAAGSGRAEVLIAGLAGQVAGAMSMTAGEWRCRHRARRSSRDALGSFSNGRNRGGGGDLRSQRGLRCPPRRKATRLPSEQRSWIRQLDLQYKTPVRKHMPAFPAQEKVSAQVLSLRLSVPRTATSTTRSRTLSLRARCSQIASVLEGIFRCSRALRPHLLLNEKGLRWGWLVN